MEIKRDEKRQIRLLNMIMFITIVSLFNAISNFAGYIMSQLSW